jgi:competence protein ComEC
VGIISAGRNNRHGHPAPAALDRLAGAGVELFRTDRDGTIRVTVDSTTMTIRGAGRAQTFPLRPRGPP